jgi:hypothetical protein
MDLAALLHSYPSLFIMYRNCGVCGFHHGRFHFFEKLKDLFFFIVIIPAVFSSSVSLFIHPLFSFALLCCIPVVFSSFIHIFSLFISILLRIAIAFVWCLRWNRKCGRSASQRSHISWSISRNDNDSIMTPFYYYFRSFICMNVTLSIYYAFLSYKYICTHGNHSVKPHVVTAFCILFTSH